MRRQLASSEIIQLGREHEVRRFWTQARAVATALFGPRASRATISWIEVPEGDHQLHVPQCIVTEARGDLLPYDFTRHWWAPFALTPAQIARLGEAHRADIVHGLGSAFDPPIRDALRSFIEEQLEIETLHRWDNDEAAALTWTLDFDATPILHFMEVITASGPRNPQALIRLGREHEARVRWQGVREYVQTLYGPQAVMAKIIFYSRYNDFTYDRDLALEVSDGAGQRIYYDLRQPWWQRFHFTDSQIAGYAERHQNLKEPRYLEYDAANDELIDRTSTLLIEDLAMRLLGAEFIATRRAWDNDEATYDLRQPPPVGQAEIWAEMTVM